MVFIYQLADYHTLNVVKLTMVDLQKKLLYMKNLLWLEVQMVFITFEEGVHCQPSHLSQINWVVIIGEDVREVYV